MSGITPILGIAGTIPIVDNTGHSLVSSGFSHNYVNVKYYSDAGATIEVTPTGGSAAVQVKMVGGVLEDIPVNGSSGQSFSYNGNAGYGEITFTGITGAVSSRVTVTQNRT